MTLISALLEQTTVVDPPPDVKRPRGLAALSPEQRRAVASMGGKAVHASGKACRFTHDTAAAAGSLGGKVVAARPGYMAEIGRRSGKKQAAIPGRMAELARRGGAASRIAAARVTGAERGGT